MSALVFTFLICVHVNSPRAIARIAKALMIPPKFLLLDSPSSLDCSSGTKGGGENGGAGFYTSYPKIPEPRWEK